MVLVMSVDLVEFVPLFLQINQLIFVFLGGLGLFKILFRGTLELLHFGLKIVIETAVFVLELFVDSVNFVDGVLEFESEGDFFVEGLIGLLEVFHEDLSLVGKVEVLIFKAFELLVHSHVFLLIELLVLLYDLLSSLDFHLEFLNFPQLIPFNLPN
jgi:hypothetical protein